MFIKKLTVEAFFNLCDKTNYSGKIRFYSHNDDSDLVQISYLYGGEHYVLCHSEYRPIMVMERSKAVRLVESFKDCHVS